MAGSIGGGEKDRLGIGDGRKIAAIADDSWVYERSVRVQLAKKCNMESTPEAQGG